MAYQEAFLEYADGTKVCYRINEHKHEKIILFVHALNESLEEYDFLFSYFDYNEIAFNAIELRGHGKSGKNEEVNFNNYLKDIKRFASGNLKNKSIYLMGHESGALTALALAFDKRFHVKGIILVAPILNLKLNKFEKYFIHLLSFFAPQLQYNFISEKKIENETQVRKSSQIISRYSTLKKINIESNKLLKNIKKIENIPALLFLNKNCTMFDNDLTAEKFLQVYAESQLLKIIWHKEVPPIFFTKDKVAYLEKITAWIKQVENLYKK